MKRYAIVIERAEGNFAAYVPDLPGCVAAGDTVAETEELMRGAIEMHLEGMREDGWRFPSRPARSTTWKWRRDNSRPRKLLRWE